jgi:hypothetical protein
MARLAGPRWAPVAGVVAVARAFYLDDIGT